MTDGREPREAVGSASTGRTLPPLFLIAASVFAVSVIVFLAVVVSAACGGDDDGGGAAIESSPTATRTTAPASTEATPAATATAPASATARPTNTTATGPSSTPDGQLVTCGDILAPVDKQHRLDRSCAPALQQLPAGISAGSQSMRPDAAQAMIEMLAAAANDGQLMSVVSAYRSYDTQVATYNGYVQSIGQEETDRTSARPGHSEHQMGTTADVSAQSVGFDLLESFGNTSEGRWLAANSWRYGFIISYPAGKESVTGYAYEPWHVRFVGKDVAANVKNSGLTLHEFLLR